MRTQPRTDRRISKAALNGIDGAHAGEVGIVGSVMASSQSGIHPTRVLRSIAALLGVLLLLTSCGTVERKPIRLAPTPTAEAGVRVIVDNCPGPSVVTLSVRDDVIWQAEAPLPDEASADGTDEVSAETLADGTESDVEVPGLIEVVVGQPPEGWTETQPLADALRSDTRYTVSTSPDDQTVDFALPDLAQGLLFDGLGRSQFNQDLMQEPCSAAADVSGFVGNIAILGLLGVTTAAFVLVALISLLFVITRRFGRIRALERKAQRAQRPNTRSSS